MEPLLNIEGEAADRRDISSLWKIYIRNKYGAAVPLRSIAEAQIVVGPQVITRYNNYRAIPIQGGPSSGTSSGTALVAMADASQQTLPAGYGYEWTGTAYQEVTAAGQTGAILGLAVLFAFLFLTSGYAHFAQRKMMAGYAGSKGVPQPLPAVLAGEREEGEQHQ